MIALLAGHGVALAVDSTTQPATPAIPEAVTRFVADPTLCAYMVSVPDGESPSLLVRYEAAMRAAVSALRAQAATRSEDEALFSLRAHCDRALASVRPSIVSPR